MRSLLLAAAVSAALAPFPLARNGPHSFGGGGGGGDPVPGPPPPFVQQPPPQIPGGVLAPVRGSPVLLAIAGGGGARREVRLRTPDGRVLSRALTDARGVAVLRAPEGEPLLLLDIPNVVPPFPVAAGQVVRIGLAGDDSDRAR